METKNYNNDNKTSNARSLVLKDENKQEIFTDTILKKIGKENLHVWKNLMTKKHYSLG